jgi:hypothetical protein
LDEIREPDVVHPPALIPEPQRTALADPDQAREVEELPIRA